MRKGYTFRVQGRSNGENTIRQKVRRAMTEREREREREREIFCLNSSAEIALHESVC